MKDYIKCSLTGNECSEVIVEKLADTFKTDPRSCVGCLKKAGVVS